MKLTMLGTGNALVTECYNTCFLLDDGGELFLTDGGGGNGILRQIKRAGYDWMDVRHMFVTHKHVDHLLGIVWMVRMICQFMHQGDYRGDAFIYSHREVLDLVRGMACGLLQKEESSLIGDRLHLVEVSDGETREIAGREFAFFDIRSEKAKQFGFELALGNGGRLVCCGDEPLAKSMEKHAAGADWMLHEAFCLHSQASLFDPYGKHHSTVKDACELAGKLQVENLLLYHTEDRDLAHRKELYAAEGMRHYHGNLWIPDDLEVLDLPG